MEDKSKLFNVLVVGENPEEIIGKYDSNKEFEPRLVYEYNKAEFYKREYLNSLRLIYAKIDEYPDINKEVLEDEILETENMSAEDYYFEMLSGLDPSYEINDETGDVYTKENPDGKYTSHRVAGYIALPFILKNGGAESYSARKGEIDWEKIHLANTRPYEIAWDTVVEGKTPNGEEEKSIYENMKERTHYFTNFESRDHYIASSTAFWEYAYVDENGWQELNGTEPQFDWVINFYDRFIKPLPENAKLTIYECSRARKNK